ncbi:MAG: phenol hydroxylase [Rugosibacter sp.]
MSVEIKAVEIKPLRNTFTNVAELIGGDKPASRYQEATLGTQAQTNMHYRPTWEPEFELFDPRRSAIQMREWYDLRDPRQLYYSSWTIQRAKEQETQEANFDFVESRCLHLSLSPEVKKLAIDVLLPLRHAAWGANMNNNELCSRAYSEVLISPAIMQAMDNLGIAQYLTRLGLMLEEPEILDTAKEQWMNGAAWQPLRHLTEDSFVIRDFMEIFLVQNFIVDGLLYPLIYDRFVDDSLTSRGGSAVAMLTSFMPLWFTQSSKWVDGVLKVAAAESDENKALLSQWTSHWRDRTITALTPIATMAFGDQQEIMLNEVIEQFNARARKLGIDV